MYKAIQTRTGEEIIILNPYWLKRIEQLRVMDHADELICQGCQQPLRVKSGDVKRAHFAHKHLKACSYGSETPELLNARAVLYTWLLERFGEGVTVEKQIEGSGLPRPVDCWVENSKGCFAYWLIEAGIKLEPREAVLAAFERQGVKVHYVFLQRMLNEEKKEFHSLLLTPTERAFRLTTAFDAVLGGIGDVGQSLHYLDADQGILTTYRGLTLFHRPNWFKGLKKTNHLDAVRISRMDGEFIHPGEAERLSAFRQKQQRLEDKRLRYRAHETARQQTASHQQAEEGQRTPGEETPTADHSALSRLSRWRMDAFDLKKRETQDQPEELPCVICGQITTDYWSTFVDDRGRRLCRCRECLDRQEKTG